MAFDGIPGHQKPDLLNIRQITGKEICRHKIQTLLSEEVWNLFFKYIRNT